MHPLAANVEATSNEAEETKISTIVHVVVVDGMILGNFRAERFSQKGSHIYFFFHLLKFRLSWRFFLYGSLFFFEVNENYLFNIYETIDKT